MGQRPTNPLPRPPIPIPLSSQINHQAGNAQFLRDEVAPKQSSERHVALHFGQKPHAVIIACSDSRVPPVRLCVMRYVLRVYTVVGGGVEAGAPARCWFM